MIGCSLFSLDGVVTRAVIGLGWRLIVAGRCDYVIGWMADVLCFVLLYDIVKCACWQSKLKLKLNLEVTPHSGSHIH